METYNDANLKCTNKNKDKLCNEKGTKENIDAASVANAKYVLQKYNEEDKLKAFTDAKEKADEAQVTEKADDKAYMDLQNKEGATEAQKKAAVEKLNKSREDYRAKDKI